MNERAKQLKAQARDFYLKDETLDVTTAELHDLVEAKFVDLLIQDFYNLCNQAWVYNQTEKNKEGISQAEQLVFAGAMAQCQKMKENIREHFGVNE